VPGSYIKDFFTGNATNFSGSQENPKVSGGRGDKKDQLQETEDKDEEGKDN
jgi:hypothetical protein